MSKKLWGGRFTGKTAQAVERFSHSLSVDRRLASYDLLGSIAHARMLGKTRIIPASEAAALVRALQTFLKESQRGKFVPDPRAEDIHTAIQWALEKRVGPKAQRLHTARSRNDQVVTAFRLFCKDRIRSVNDSIRRLQREILHQARKAGGLTMPGYTHLRHAQPVLAAHALLSYLPMLERDRERLKGASQRADELPLGSGALTGTSLPIDRAFVARQLGFSRICENSMDGVTDRDFAVEFLSALSLLSVHFSRIAEDLILWSTAEFGFIRFEENLLTGSSMMPQKQNPDFLELIRGGCARVTGNLAAALTLLKGLPTGYQRDLQGDKELLFEALDRIEGMLEVLRLGMGGIGWNREKLNAQMKEESLYATDLAEFLVAEGVPFAQAHRAVGQLLLYADRAGKRLADLPLSAFRRFAPAFDGRVYSLLNPSASVRRKRSAGGTHPAAVARAIRRWAQWLKR